MLAAKVIAESAALKRANRELVELRRDAMARKLISLEEIGNAWAEIIRSVRQLVLSIPARCQEEMAHLRFEDFEKFRSIVREALTEAAQMTPDEPIPGVPDAAITTPRKRGRPPGGSTSL